MGVKVEGLLETGEMLLVLETDTKRRAVVKLYAAAKQVQALAKRMAPREYGNLEDAIKIDPDNYAGPARDVLGRFTRIEITVYVDEGMEGDHGLVGQYAYIQHEHLTPYGDWQLGPISAAKQAANPDITVGGGYMERAGQAVEDELNFEDL